MTTQILQARKGVITEEMEYISKQEGISAQYIRQKVEEGKIIILKNSLRTETIPVGIGDCLRVKINANIGTKEGKSSLADELDKARIAFYAGADTLVDLSTGDYIEETHQAILSQTKMPTGTTPIYSSAKEIIKKYNSIAKLTKEKLIDDIEKQCKDGVDFIRLHCGMTKNTLKRLENQKRYLGISSKSGKILAGWMDATGQENPYFEEFNKIVQIAKTYDVVLSLASALKSGSCDNGFDISQNEEILTMCELANIAHKEGVQVMLEGIGHFSLEKIPAIIKLIKGMSNDKPLFIHSAIACDYTYGYENITNAIGATICALNGANMINSITPKDNSNHISALHLKEGIVSAKIAANCADLANKKEYALKQNEKITQAKTTNNWQSQKELNISNNIYERTFEKEYTQSFAEGEISATAQKYIKHI